MIDISYIRANLAGAWAVMLGREEGLSRLDLTADGFWRSFAVILLILPFVVVTMLGEHIIVSAVGAALPPMEGADFAWAFLVMLADWIAFPVILAILARPLGLAQNYGRFVIARNWSAFITAALAAVLYSIYIAGIVPAGTAPYAILGLLIVSLRFAYKVAKIGLGVPPAVALPVVLVDFLLSLLIQGSLGG